MTISSRFVFAKREPRPVGSLSCLLLLVVLAAGLIVPVATPASAQSGGVIEISGRGWGHGRGLGQYGAYGYANQGWSSAQILDHFYGGTSAGPAPTGGSVDPNAVRAELRFMRGRTTTVSLNEGAIVLRGLDDAELGRIETGAVRLRWTGGNFAVETSSDCGGTWAAHSSIDGRTTVRLIADSSATGSLGLLRVCGLSHNTWYRGEVRAVVENSFPMTVNVVSIEDYLRGVVPNEMPASWPDAALQAQAVAARSYALAGDTRQQPYADTCDTTRCQVYDGAYTDRGGLFGQATHPRTDAAIAATAGLVRLRGSGDVARTEFSSSTGGYTAGGDFPAVVDDGDSISANPNHTWTKTVSISTIENRYGLGRLEAMEVTGRNGAGADGGRVTEVRFTFERGSVTESGNSVRSFLGLKSDWFTPAPLEGTDQRATPEGTYIDRVYQKLAGRSASSSEIDQWFDAVRRGDRRDLTNELVTTDYFAGEMVDDLYQSALGRGSDAGGRQYWVGQMANGLKLESVGIFFFGSAEYYLRSGGTDAAFVSALYRDILGRAADVGGQAYWEAALASGSSLPDVAAGFYASLESRRTRAVGLHERLLGPVVSTTVRDALANRLLTVDDLELAAEIAASIEAYEA